MDAAVATVWIAGLVVALVLTLAVLKLVFLVHRVLDDIVRLSRVIREASRGIADNVRPLAEGGERGG